MLTTEAPGQQSSFFERNPKWLKICLVFLFLCAALIRRDEIRAPGHLIEREYNSAIFARYFYFNASDNIEGWRKANAVAARESLPVLEPPLTEYLVSLIYRVMGREEIWYSRILTSLFWLLGGIFIYKITQMLVSVDAAIVAVAYYLFVPWGIIISRSFQPDALMMLMFLSSIYCILLYFERPSWGKLILAGTITGITLLLRPLVVFALFCAFFALFVYKKRTGSRVLYSQFLVFFALSLIFPVAFYGYGIFVGKFLQAQADLSFRPYLLPRLEFWKGWLSNAVTVPGRTAIVFAVIGFFVLRNNTARILVVGLTAGYFAFGLVFTYHIYSHPYYQIQLFLPIALCASALLVAVGHAIIPQIKPYWWMPVAAGILLALYFTYTDERSMLYVTDFEDPDLSREIGEVVNHNPRTVFVAYHYGLPLEYYGEFSGLPWPVSIDDPFFRRPGSSERTVQERLDALGFVPEYYIITNLDLYDRKHTDLKTYLEQSCNLLAQAEQYLIYSSCKDEAGR